MRAAETHNTQPAPAYDAETVISYILITGVMVSLVLLVIGSAVFGIQHGNFDLAYSLPQDNLFQFMLLEGGHFLHWNVTAKDFINLGIIILMMTPFTRIAFSIYFFAFVERNRKYTLFTAFVLLVLSYSLFLRF